MPKNTCPNGHPANSSGDCFDADCPYRHRPSGREDGNAQAWSERTK
jgi:hypothetical protein